MFDSMDDQIRKDDRAGVTAAERWGKRLLIATLSVVLFGALYVGIRALE